MKNKFNTISFKLIFSFFISILLSCLSIFFLGIFFLAILSLVVSSNKTIANFFYEHIISFIVLFFTLFIALIIIFFLIIIREKKYYIEDITDTIEHVSKNNLDIDITVKGKDKLGRIASSINFMSHRLRH
ncbi:hypothetical protein GCM10008908_00660 [Clostridium subterminale]|uniref:HAMP domain-containing protein n=1 Tax=Clostridium subterminale TaxID=1550 RepID=A0ABN1KFI8_CLOSU